MLSAFIGLLLAFLVMRGLLAIARRFMAWLGRGRRLRGVVESGRFDEEMARTIVLRDDVFSRIGPDGRPRRLSWRQVEGVMSAVDQARDEYVSGMRIGWYQVVIIFLVGSMAGLVLEEVWMYVTAGLTESRVGLVWGPFSPLYGFGAVLLTLVCWALRSRRVSDSTVFLVSMVIGGTLEQVTGWTMATVFGMESWTYLGLSDHITQWVAWRFLLFWGIIGLVWHKVVMPDVLFGIGMPTTRRQVAFVALLAAYLALDIFMTAACFVRMEARDAGIPARGAFDEWVDENYDDRFIESTFQNLVIYGKTDGKTDGEAR